MFLDVNKKTIIYTLAFSLAIGVSVLLLKTDFNPKLLLFGVALILAVAILKDYMIGLYLICFLIPLDAAATIIPGFTFTKYIGIITVGSFIIYGIINEKTKYKKLNPYLLGFFVWAALSILWAIDLNWYFSRIMNLANYIVFIFMMLNSRKPEKNINKFLMLYLLGCIILSVLGFQQFIVHGGLERSSAFGEDQNFYGITIGIGLLIALYLSKRAGFITKRLFLNISILILIAGLMVSLSRTAWVATMIAIVFYLLAGSKNKIKSFLVSVGLVVMVYLLAFYISSFLDSSLFSDRLLSILNFADSSNRAAGRLDIWIVGWNIFKDHFFLGVGLNNFPVAFTDQYVIYSNTIRSIGVGRDPHNIYLGISTELGLIGFVLFISIFISTFKKINRSKLDFSNRYFAYSIIIFLLVAGFANTIFYKKYFWFSFAIVWLLIQGKESAWKAHE